MAPIKGAMMLIMESSTVYSGASHLSPKEVLSTSKAYAIARMGISADLPHQWASLFREDVATVH